MLVIERPYTARSIAYHSDIVTSGWHSSWLGVAETANQAFDSALLLHDRFQQNLFGIASVLARDTSLSEPTVNAALADPQRLGILKEVIGRRRNRVFAYRAYLDILGEGAETLPAR